MEEIQPQTEIMQNDELKQKSIKKIIIGIIVFLIGFIGINWLIVAMVYFLPFTFVGLLSILVPFIQFIMVCTGIYFIIQGIAKLLTIKRKGDLLDKQKNINPKKSIIRVLVFIILGILIFGYSFIVPSPYEDMDNFNYNYLFGFIGKFVGIILIIIGLVFEEKRHQLSKRV